MWLEVSEKVVAKEWEGGTLERSERVAERKGECSWKGIRRWLEGREKVVGRKREGVCKVLRRWLEGREKVTGR